jgi:hypothetical protein
MPPVSPLEGGLATKSSDKTPARPREALHGRARWEPAGAVTDVARLGISSRDHVRIPVVGRDHRSDRSEPGAAPSALRAKKLRQWRRLVGPALGHEPHGTRRPVGGLLNRRKRIRNASCRQARRGELADSAWTTENAARRRLGAEIGSDLCARSPQYPTGSFARRAALRVVTWGARRTLPSDIHHAGTVALAADLPNRLRLLVALHRVAPGVACTVHSTVPRSWPRRDHPTASDRATGIRRCRDHRAPERRPAHQGPPLD